MGTLTKYDRVRLHMSRDRRESKEASRQAPTSDIIQTNQASGSHQEGSSCQETIAARPPETNSSNAEVEERGPLSILVPRTWPRLCKTSCYITHRFYQQQLICRSTSRNICIRTNNKYGFTETICYRTAIYTQINPDAKSKRW